MHRNGPTTAGVRVLAAVTALTALLGLPSTASALPLISEVFYDAAGTDDGLVFVELHGAPGTDLTGLVIEGINGSNGAVTDSITLSGVIPADGFFVVADGLSDGTTLVPEADLIDSFDFQNGPDSVVLQDAGLVLDAVGYGVFGAGDVFAGEGAPAPDAPAGSSLARFFADVDSDDNLSDFEVLSEPTPGFGVTQVSEPRSTLLLGAALSGLALMGRSRRRAEA